LNSDDGVEVIIDMGSIDLKMITGPFTVWIAKMHSLGMHNRGIRGKASRQCATIGRVTGGEQIIRYAKFLQSVGERASGDFSCCLSVLGFNSLNLEFRTYRNITDYHTGSGG
jgi:hypothetical protein